MTIRLAKDQLLFKTYLRDSQTGPGCKKRALCSLNLDIQGHKNQYPQCQNDVEPYTTSTPNEATASAMSESGIPIAL
jgi:hypothetical protein